MRVLLFTSLVLINMGLILVNRSFKASLVRAILQPNRSLWILLGTVSVLLAIAILWPPARSLFHFGRLHWDDLSICAAVGVSSLIALEALKSVWFRHPAGVIGEPKRISIDDSHGRQKPTRFPPKV